MLDWAWPAEIEKYGTRSTAWFQAESGNRRGLGKETDTETQRGLQLADFFEALEKDRRTEDEKNSPDCIHGGT